jgi:hypothetical protein
MHTHAHKFFVLVLGPAKQQRSICEPVALFDQGFAVSLLQLQHYYHHFYYIVFIRYPRYGAHSLDGSLDGSFAQNNAMG